MEREKREHLNQGQINYVFIVTHAEKLYENHIYSFDIAGAENYGFWFRNDCIFFLFFLILSIEIIGECNIG